MLLPFSKTTLNFTVINLSYLVVKSLLVGCFNGSSDVVVTTSIFFKKYINYVILKFSIRKY